MSKPLSAGTLRLTAAVRHLLTQGRAVRRFAHEMMSKIPCAVFGHCRDGTDLAQYVCA